MYTEISSKRQLQPKKVLKYHLGIHKICELAHFVDPGLPSSWSQAERVSAGGRPVRATEARTAALA
jgi:hypothetical protein